MTGTAGGLTSRDASGGGLDARAGEAGRGRRRSLRRVVSWAAGLVVVALLAVTHWVLEPVRVDSDSMLPTLRPGDGVLLLHHPFAGPVARGDIVVVGPGWARAAVAAGRVPESSADASFVKRVVGLAGDEVAIEDGQLLVDGVAVPEPWVDAETMDGVWFGPVTVPTGEVFVMGDDRFRSVDSRELGPAPLTEVEGRVLAPWPRWWGTVGGA